MEKTRSVTTILDNHFVIFFFLKNPFLPVMDTLLNEPVFLDEIEKSRKSRHLKYFHDIVINVFDRQGTELFLHFYMKHLNLTKSCRRNVIQLFHVKNQVLEAVSCRLQILRCFFRSHRIQSSF